MKKPNLKKTFNSLIIMIFCFYETFAFSNISLAPKSNFPIKSDLEAFISPHKIGKEAFMSIVIDTIKKHGEMKHGKLANQIGSSLQVVQAFRKKYDNEIVNKIGKAAYLSSLQMSKLVSPKKVGKKPFALLIANYIQENGEATNKEIAEGINCFKDTVRTFRAKETNNNLIINKLGGLEQYLLIIKKYKQLSVEKVGADIFKDQIVNFIKKNGEASHSEIAIAIGSTMSNVQRFRIADNKEIIDEIGKKEYLDILKEHNQVAPVYIGNKKFAKLLAETIEIKGELSNKKLGEMIGSSKDIVRTFRSDKKNNDLVISAIGGMMAYKALLKTRKQVNVTRIGKKEFLNNIVQIAIENNGVLPSIPTIADKIGSTYDVAFNFIHDDANKEDILNGIGKDKVRNGLSQENSISATTIGDADFFKLIAENIKKNEYTIIDLTDLATQINSTKRIVAAFIKNNKPAIIDLVGRQEYYAAVRSRNDLSGFSIGKKEFMNEIIESVLKRPGPFPAGKDIAHDIGSTKDIVNRFIRKHKDEFLLEATKRSPNVDKYLHILWQRDKKLAVQTFLQKNMQSVNSTITYPTQIALETFFKSNYKTIKPYYKEVIDDLESAWKYSFKTNDLLTTDKEIASAVGRSIEELYEYFEYVVKLDNKYNGGLWDYLAQAIVLGETDSLIQLIMKHHKFNVWKKYINWRLHKFESTVKAIKHLAYIKYQKKFKFPEQLEISETIGIKAIDLNEYMSDEKYMENGIHKVWHSIQKNNSQFARSLHWYFDHMAAGADYMTNKKVYLFGDDDMFEKISNYYSCSYSEVENIMHNQQYKGVFYPHGVIDYILDKERTTKKEKNNTNMKKNVEVENVGEFVYVQGMVNGSIDYFKKHLKLPAPNILAKEIGYSVSGITLYLDIMYEEIIEITDSQDLLLTAMWKLDKDEAAQTYIHDFFRKHEQIPSNQQIAKYFHTSVTTVYQVLQNIGDLGIDTRKVIQSEKTTKKNNLLSLQETEEIKQSELLNLLISLFEKDNYKSSIQVLKGMMGRISTSKKESKYIQILIDTLSVKKDMKAFRNNTKSLLKEVNTNNFTIEIIKKLHKYLEQSRSKKLIKTAA